MNFCKKCFSPFSFFLFLWKRGEGHPRRNTATVFSLPDLDDASAAAARFNAQTMKKNVKWRGRGSIAFLAAALLPRHSRPGERLIKPRANENRRSPPVQRIAGVYISNETLDRDAIFSIEWGKN